MIALRSLTDNLTSLNASRFDRQSKRLTQNVIRLIPVGHTLGKIAGSIGHVLTPVALHSDRSIALCGNSGILPSIQRKMSLSGCRSNGGGLLAPTKWIVIPTGNAV
jgi:hypothetical protein